MAEVGLRETVNDPLALNPYQQAPQRTLPVSGVRNPRMTGGDDWYDSAMQGFDALGKLGGALADAQREISDKAVTEGKLMYMQGITEDEIAKTGNQYNMQGWQALNAADKANRWYADEIAAIGNGNNQMSPDQYGSYVMERRKKFLDGLPDDPAIRKVYVAQFEDLGPRLVSQQVSAHNEYNQNQSEVSFGNYLSSGSYTNADTPRVLPDSELSLSDGIVRERVAYNNDDVDSLTRALIGEAGGEGSTGMAAVAHVIMNRALDGRFGGNTIKGVVMEPGQFSSFNGETGYAGGAGANSGVGASDKSRAYQVARKIAEDVLSGHNVDPTNGATHFYSPAGMALLVKQGKQSNLVPSWWDGVAAQGTVDIGGHKFAGRYRAGAGQAMPITLDPQTGEVQTVEQYGANGAELQVGQGADPQAVTAAQGIPNATTPSPAQTQTQDFVRNYNMPPDKKAAAVTSEMLTQLDAGNTQLWDNLGGTGFLRELGATPQQVRQVQSARERYDREQANKFSVDKAAWDNTLIKRVENGELTVEEAGKEISAKYDAKQLSDTGAYGLMQQVYNASSKESKDIVQKPELLRGLANVYQSIRTDPTTYTAEWAQTKIEALADQYGVPKKQLEARIAEAWQTEESAKIDLNNKAVSAAQKRQQVEAKMAEVQTAVAIGRGLNNIDGDINGKPAKQWGIDLMRKDLIEQHTKQLDKWTTSVTQGGLGMSQEEAQRKAAAAVDADLWGKLYQQGGIVDEETAEAMTAGASGVIIDSKGEVAQSAIEALDTYMRMQIAPGVGAGYASKYFYNEDARNLMMNAERFARGGFDLETALRKANEFTKDGLGAAPDVRTTDNFRGKLYDASRDNFDKLMGQPSWFSQSGVNVGDEAYAKTHMDQLRSAVGNRAWAYFAAEPQNDPSVIIKKAAEDVANEGSIVGGNILIPTRKGNSVRDQMGLSEYQNDEPAKAVDRYLQNYAETAVAAFKANDKSDMAAYAFGEAWSSREQSYIGYGLQRGVENMAAGPMGNPFGFLARRETMTRQTPAYYAKWDDQSGTMTIQLWDNDKRENTVDPTKVPPIIVSLPEIGAWYKKSIGVDKASAGQNMWKDLWN